MKPGCTLIAYLHAKPEKREELLKLLQSFVEPSRSEPACVDYHLHVSNDDPNLFVFYENWRTRKELDEHLQTPILTSFWSRRLDLLEKDVDDQVYHHAERTSLNSIARLRYANRFCTSLPSSLKSPGKGS